MKKGTAQLCKPAAANNGVLYEFCLRIDEIVGLEKRIYFLRSVRFALSVLVATCAIYFLLNAIDVIVFSYIAIWTMCSVTLTASVLLSFFKYKPWLRRLHDNIRRMDITLLNGHLLLDNKGIALCYKRKGKFDKNVAYNWVDIVGFFQIYGIWFLLLRDFKVDYLYGQVIPSPSSLKNCPSLYKYFSFLFWLGKAAIACLKILCFIAAVGLCILIACTIFWVLCQLFCVVLASKALPSISAL